MVQNFSATLKYIISFFFALYQLLQSHLGIYTYASYLEPLLSTPKEIIRIITFSPPRTRSKTLFSKLNPRTYTETYTPTVIQGGEGGGLDGTPPQSFWYVAVFRNDFIFSGKPLSCLTRWGIFYGWWRSWRPVTSPTIVAILDAILDFARN